MSAMYKIEGSARVAGVGPEGAGRDLDTGIRLAVPKFVGIFGVSIFRGLINWLKINNVCSDVDPSLSANHPSQLVSDRLKTRLKHCKNSYLTFSWCLAGGRDASVKCGYNCGYQHWKPRQIPTNAH